MVRPSMALIYNRLNQPAFLEHKRHGHQAHFIPLLTNGVITTNLTVNLRLTNASRHQVQRECSGIEPLHQRQTLFH